MLMKRDELQCTVGPDGRLYAIGGYGCHKPEDPIECLSQAERYDFAIGQWEMLPPMTDNRRALAVVAMPDGIYALGGYDGQRYLASCEKFCLMTNKWVRLAPM